MSNLMGGRSLRDDSNLIDLLKKQSDLMHERMLDTDTRLRSLSSDVSTLTKDLEVAQNTLCVMKDQRYVKEVIVDDASDIRSRISGSKAPTRSKADRESRYRDAVLYATNAGLRMVEQQYHPVEVQIPNEALLDKSLLPEPVWEPLDPYLVRDLPPIIGSREFDGWEPGAPKILNERMEVSEIVIGRNRMPVQPTPAAGPPPPPPPAPPPPPTVTPTHIPASKPVIPTPPIIPVVPVSSTPISRIAESDTLADEFGESMRISAPLAVVTEQAPATTPKSSAQLEKATNVPAKPLVANLGPKIIPLSAADEAKIKKHSIFSDESDDDDSTGDLFAAAKNLSQSRSAPRLPPRTSPKAAAPPPPPKTQKSPSQPQKPADPKVRVTEEIPKTEAAPKPAPPPKSGGTPKSAVLSEKPKPMNSKTVSTAQKSLFQDSDDDEFERLFGASSQPQSSAASRSAAPIVAEKKAPSRQPVASTSARPVAPHRSLFDSTSSDDDEVDLFSFRPKPKVQPAPVESKVPVAEAAPEDPLASKVQLPKSPLVDPLSAQPAAPEIPSAPEPQPAVIPLVSEPSAVPSAPEPQSAPIAFAFDPSEVPSAPERQLSDSPTSEPESPSASEPHSAVNPFEFSIDDPPPLSSQRPVAEDSHFAANPLIPPEASNPPAADSAADPLSSSAIEADDEQSQRADEEMPKAVLSSVGNDFSNRLNAALLRKPPTTASPITKDVEPLAAPTLQPSPIRRTASASVESRKSESVKALSSRLGDSITRAHTRGRTPSSVGADSDSAPKKSISSSSDSDTRESAKPAASAADPFAAVKSRPGPQRRRPPTVSARPASTVAAATPPAAPKSPASTTKPPTAEKTPTSPKKKPFETSKSTNVAKSLKNIFDTDSSDDPF